MSTELVRNPIAIPPALAQAGVQVVEQNGVRSVMIPAALSQHYNIVQPISEVTQADPDWSPRLVVINLSDPQYHYNEQGKEALTKNAILLLSRAAGITLTVERESRDKFLDTQFGFKAIATVTLSDGTQADYPGHKMGDYDDLREEIKGTQKKWLVEKQHYPGKIETKAMLRAISAALQLKRGGYTKADLNKPFLIVAVSSTPADPEVRRLRALRAGDALAGRGLPAPSVETHETSQYDEPMPAQQIAPAVDVVDQVPATAVPQDDTAGEPPLPPEPVRGEMPADVAAAGDTLIGFGEAGRRGLKICELSDEHLTWLAVEYEPTGIAAAQRQVVIDAGRKYRNWKLAQS